MDLKKLNEELQKFLTKNNSKNEAVMQHGTEIAMDKIAGGFTCFFGPGKYGEKQTEINVGFFSSTQGGVYIKPYESGKAEEAEQQMLEDKTKIMQELKTISDKLDADVEALLNKYGYTLEK